MMISDDNLGPIVHDNSYIKSVLLRFRNQLSISHMNCRSLRPPFKINELRSILNENFFNIFAVSETWLTSDISNRMISVPGYKICRNDRLISGRGGGVAMYIANGLRYRIVFKSSGSRCESLFIELILNEVKLLLGVVYLPTGDLDDFESCHKDLFSRYAGVVVLGDFNCNLFNISRANSCRSFCTRYNLNLVHNSKPTHFDLRCRSTSLIDFMLVSNPSLISYSDQVQCPSVSDHSLIFASLHYNFQQPPEFFEFRDYKNIDWVGLFASLEDFDRYAVFNARDVDTKCALVSSLLNSLFSFVPTVKRKIRDCNDKWMESREIVLARSLRDLSYSAFLSCRSDEKWKTYCKYRNKAKSVIRRIRRNHFSKLFWGLDATGMWKVLKHSGYVGDDNFNDDFDANEVNEFFVEGGGTHDDGSQFSCEGETDSSFSFCCVNEFEIIEAISRVKSGSVGVDGIPMRFIKTVFPYVSDVILDLVNFILMSSSFPLAWKIARVIPIPKAKHVRRVDDLRPISILPAMSKIVEHIMKNQILQSSQLRIHDMQYAFRQGLNTTHLLLKLTDSIRVNANNGKRSVMVSLDLSKAFNSINFVRLLTKLRDFFNFSTSACKLILSYLSNRSQFVVLSGANSSMLSLHSGVPQGSILGPLLFILYVNDLHRFTSCRSCEAFMFADDIFLLFNGSSTTPDILENDINSVLGRVVNWASANALRINPSKSKALMFGNFTTTSLNIFVGNSEIEFVDRHRCLGVIVDTELSFRYHIDALSGKVWSCLRKMYSSIVYLPFKVRKLLAYSLLMSQILYGLEVFSGTIQANFTKLRRIVNSVVRFVYNVRRRDRISCFVKRFLNCSFKRFVECRNLLLFHNAFANIRPVPLRRIFVFSRSTRNPQLFIPRIRRNIYARSYAVRVARCWNRLPHELRIFSHSNNVFRLKLFDFYNSFADG